MNEHNERWKAIAVYRTENGPVDVEHYVEEITDLHTLIERGPHWGALIECVITLNRTHPDDDGLTIEKAEAL